MPAAGRHGHRLASVGPMRESPADRRNGYASGMGDSAPLEIELALFVVTGTSGAGKTTITQPLRRLLPECVVFETDAILSMATIGWDAWRSTWLLVAREVALGGRATVLTGSLTPDQMRRLPARKLMGPLRFANLDCPDHVLAEGVLGAGEVAEQVAGWVKGRLDAPDGGPGRGEPGR